MKAYLQYRRSSTTVVGVDRFDDDAAPPVPVVAGDVVWLLNRLPGDAPDTEGRVAARMPAGLALGKPSRLSVTPMLWTYRVERAPSDHHVFSVAPNAGVVAGTLFS